MPAFDEAFLPKLTYPFCSVLEINGQEDALIILLRNLVDNAVRYTPDNGIITLTVKNSAENTIVCVSDTGPGIPESQRGVVFERFKRLSQNSSEGSGLGLSIVRRIATLHNADITIQSNENGGGLTICVCFPLLTGA